ncbi:hypothetical protein m02_10110 [Bartonella bovis m02]|uniref:Right handed beta helix domain-containing protein n=2 Tax=Bartonella bovis TaxID=155194 RepID=N6UKF7_9HYPH|nr:hypothetical protein m02_10110 [Bartonella bovis m02]
MVMGCVFKHHVYLCVVSTAMLAGLSLITSHTKVYAQQTNCGTVDSTGDVVNEPIVCDRSGTMVLNTSSSGRGNKIEIKMSKHSDKEAVKIMGGADIIAIKKLTVTVTGWNGKGPVIKVDGGGKLTLKGGVEVTGVVKGVEKVIEVNGGGELMLMGKSTIKVDGSGGNGKVVGVQMGSMEKLMMMRDVTFEGVTEGININGSKEGVMVMGLGTGTMTVNGKGSVGIKVEGSGSIDATVMRLKIVGDRSGGKGVVMGMGGTLNMTSVGISGFETGVSASGKGMVEMMGNSTITFKGGTGLSVSGEANATMIGGKIVGDGSGTGTGVVMGSTGMVMLNMVNISDVRGSGGGTGKYGVQMTGEGTMVLMGGSIMGFETGVEATAGTLKMMGGTAITVTSGGTGLEVKGEAMATLMGGTTIKGDGKGYGVKMGSSKTLKMMGEVGISNVGMGVEVKSGTVEMSGVGISQVEKGV